MSTDTLEPPIEDGSGYCVRERDLRFLFILPEAVARWREKHAPLGMSEVQYKGFCEALTEAVERDGLDPASCDVRLKGSSAAFFSGHHMRLPTSRDAVIDIFREIRKRVPERWEVDEILDRLSRQWIGDGEFPQRRLFDALFRLGIEREPSDIDLQVSADELVERCVDVLGTLGQDPTTLRLEHPTYNFVRKDLVDRACPNLYLFGLRMTDALNRHVSLAIFPSVGPPDTSETHGPLSAHFRTDDWRVPVRQLEAGAS